MPPELLDPEELLPLDELLEVLLDDPPLDDVELPEDEELLEVEEVDPDEPPPEAPKSTPPHPEIITNKVRTKAYRWVSRTRRPRQREFVIDVRQVSLRVPIVLGFELSLRAF